MTFNLLIAPDFAPERFAGWHLLNTVLQKKSGLALHLLTPASAAEQAQLIADGKVYRQNLKPGQAPEATFCVQADNVSAREYCNLHGLWKA